MIGAIAGTGALALAALGVGLAAWSARYVRDAEQRVPADGHFIELPDARVHYQDIGSGPPIVLVHGLGGQQRNFTYSLAERLAPHHRLLIIDRPGSGYSTWTSDTDWSLAANAAVVSQFIAAKGLERPLLVGHSLGGAISLALAVQHPGTVSGLALLAPLTQPDSPVSELHKGLFIPSTLVRRLVAHTLAAPMSKRNKETIGKAVFGPEPAPDDFDVRGGSALTARPSAFFAASSEISNVNAELIKLVEHYGEIALPVGILYGREDQILPATLHGDTAIQQIPGSTLTVISGGHMIPITAPDFVADWIIQQHQRTMAT